ncbi:unnamed protein product [Rotaria magnacalcarata]|uniref:Uncharacterized protein n=1 Tax=Rotaria magnacalcarata TaxID=392030 RepID=A0A816YJX0_9BILA|nr:unnamed protein product [Rotaria magnacalcarata]
MSTDTTGSDHIYSETSNDRNENLTMVPILITTIDDYFIDDINSFQLIRDLNENLSKFCIRCKIIYISPIRYFVTNNKVFDAIVCDSDDEIKVVGFNDEVERIYHLMLLNKTIIIENGRIQKSNENYRTAYSLFEIRLVSNTNIQLYKSNIFNPNIKITKRTIHDITQLANGSSVGTEGQIINDNGVSTTTSQTDGSTFQRRSIKIQDETGKINITIWNKKVNYDILTKQSYTNNLF